MIIHTKKRKKRRPGKKYVKLNKQEIRLVRQMKRKAGKKAAKKTAHKKHFDWFAKMETMWRPWFQTMRYQDYLQTDYWKAIRLMMFKTHGKVCSRCQSKWLIQVHHLSYNFRGREHRSMRDLQILCRTCHRQEHGLSPVHTLPKLTS